MSPELVWSAELTDQVQVPPTVVEGTVYVGDVQGRLQAFDAGSGSEEWSFDLDGVVVRAPPVYDDGTLYVGVYHGPSDGTLHAFDANTGMEGWRYSGGSVGGAAVDADTVYVGPGRSVVALDVMDGAERWTFDTGSYTGTPVLADGVVCVACEDQEVYALDAETGDGVWSLATGGSVNSGNNRPVADDGTVYVGDWNSVYAVDARTGRGEWSADLDGLTAIPVLGHGSVYVGGGDAVTALDASTGETRWTATVGDGELSPPAAGREGVYVCDGDGTLYELDPDDGEQLSALDISEDPLYQPAVTDTALFVASASGESTTDRSLYAVDLLPEGTPEQRASTGEDPPAGFRHRDIGPSDDTGGDRQTSADEPGGDDGDVGGGIEVGDAVGSDAAEACPSCDRSLTGDEAFCPGCGADLSSAPACPECGADLDGDEAFCPACGHALAE